ncbi:hypothetical protein HCN51_27405 [Nonomuraea sp. FMUSA5-5]|uniref:Lipoprotein n=1 Tax=Nonomuraea composti TaxID=2720023 RepID=A0ABX1B5N0_9ACTN|nr:hypothetical protein [Nonomuraea sp. FMUSA5-5]NJP93129.1 hypothetical protein [Nonomuraea sp. FMUSA5-5]
MTAIVLAASLLAGGCAAQPEEVDPGVLGEVRKLGAVVWEERHEGLSGTETVVTNSLVVDISGNSEAESLQKAVARLHSRNWVISTDASPLNVWMKSPQWEGATIALNVFSVSDEQDDPEVKKVLARQGSRSGQSVPYPAELPAVCLRLMLKPHARQGKALP